MADGLNKQYRTLRVVPEDKRDVKYGDSRLDGVSVDVAKFKPIAEKIKELQIAQRDDGREDHKKLAEMYADVTAHRVWKIVNQLASQLNQKLDEQADGWQDDAKKLLKDQLKEIEKLVASGAKTLQQAVQGAPVVKEIIKEVQKLVQPLSDKVDKLASESASSGSKTSGGDSGASRTKPNFKPASKTDTFSSADVAVPAAFAVIAQRISKLQQSIDGKIMSAFGKQNSLSLRVAEMVENIDKNLVGAGTGKAVQRKLNYAQYKVDSKAYSPIVRTATPNKKSGGLLMGFGAGLELGKALPGLLAKAIIGLPVLAVAWLGKKIFSFAGKALAWLFKPLHGALKFLVGAVGLILTPIKFIFGVLSTIGGVILGVVSFALKGVFAVLGGIFKLATGIAKGVFKVVAGIFSFVPKAITWGFKTAFSMLKGIWGGVKSIWNWTKESIKSPGKIYKIAFIAGFVYGFIIKQIKKHGFMEWMTTLLKSAWKGLKIAGGFLWDSATAFAGWLKDQWNEHLKPAIVGWWDTWEPGSKFGKFIKNNVNWVIDLFSDEPGPNGKGVLGKNGLFMQWIDNVVNTIKGWFFDDEHVINQLLDNYEKKNKSTFMSDAKTEVDWRAEKRGVRKEMLEAFKDPKLKAQLIAEYGQGIELDMTSPLTDIRNWLSGAFKEGGWLKSAANTIGDIFKWFTEGAGVFSQKMLQLFKGERSISQILDESKAFSKIATISLGVGGGLVGSKIGSLFGPWGTLIGAAVGAGAGLIYDAYKKEELKEQANMEYLQQGSETLKQGLSEKALERYNKLINALPENKVKELKERLETHSKKISEYRNKYQGEHTSDKEKDVYLKELARHTRLYEITYKALNRGYEDIAQYDKEYETYLNRKIGQYQKGMTSVDQTMHDYFGYASIRSMGGPMGMPTSTYAVAEDFNRFDIDKSQEAVRKALNAGMGDGNLKKVQQIRDKLKQNGFYSRMGAESEEERQRVDQFISAMLMGNKKYTQGEWRMFKTNDWLTDERMAEFETDFNNLVKSDDELFNHIKGTKPIGEVDHVMYYDQDKFNKAKAEYEVKEKKAREEQLLCTEAAARKGALEAAAELEKIRSANKDQPAIPGLRPYAPGATLW